MNKETGMKDKNGIPIVENDELVVNTNGLGEQPRFGTVIYDKHFKKFIIKFGGFCVNLKDIRSSECEIVGNTVLLKRGEEIFNNTVLLTRDEEVEKKVIKNTPTRPIWDDYFKSITNVVASRSNCLHRAVGAVIVKDNRLLTTGYNGAPSGMNHCIVLGGCNKEKHGFGSGTGSEYCRAVHAEQNAIIQAAKFGISINGATLFCTHYPCTTCAKMIIASGIVRLVYWNDYPNDLAKNLLSEAGIIVDYIGD